MKNSKTQSVWSNIPDKLIKLSTSLKEYIESDSYLNDQHGNQSNSLTLTKLINWPGDNSCARAMTIGLLAYYSFLNYLFQALKNELHEGVAYVKFIDTEENRQILCQYLQYQLNQIESLKRDFNVFLNKNNIPCFAYKNDFFTPTSPNISPPQQSMILSNPSSPFQFDGRVNQKKNFIDSIRFFLSKLQYQKESYIELYSQKDSVNNYLSINLMKHKSALPQTTYSLERLCEIVRTSLQELRQQILEVSIVDRNTMQQEQLSHFKKVYNKIKTIPLIQYIAKLYKIIKELKTASFQFTKAIATFEKHLSDKKNLQNAQELIEQIEQESDVRFRMRQQSDPTQELTPSKKINAGVLTTCKTLSKCVNENIFNSPNFEFSNEQTDDHSSIQDDTSSLFQSQISTSYNDRRIPNPMQNRDEEKENSRQNQNRNYDQKCNSAITKSQSNIQYDKNIQAASDNQPLRKTVSNVSQNNTNNDKTNNKAAGSKKSNSKDISKLNTEQSPEGTEILTASQKKQKKSILEDLRYKRNTKEFSEIKDSVVSNAQSSFVDGENLTDRKYDFQQLKKSDDKCMSNCSIF